MPSLPRDDITREYLPDDGELLLAHRGYAREQLGQMACEQQGRREDEGNRHVRLNEVELYKTTMQYIAEGHTH